MESVVKEAVGRATAVKSDKVAQAFTKLNEVKGEMQKNVRSMIEN